MNQTINEVFKRKSVRVFEDKEISQEEINYILEGSKQAPTAGNMMMYSIISVTDQAKKDILAVSCDNQPFIAQSKLCLIYCADFKKYYDLFKIYIGENARIPKEAQLLLAIEDAMCAAQNAVVVAESLGIGSCYIGDILENKEQITELLNLPKYVLPITMLVFGYPTQQQKDRVKPTRFKTEHIVFENEYKELNKEELDAMLQNNFKNNPLMTPEKFITSLYNRKYGEGFMDEMQRSSKLWVKEWE